MTVGMVPQWVSHVSRPSQTERARVGRVEMVIGGWDVGEVEEEGEGERRGEMRS
jgi:hypothetical protein